MKQSKIEELKAWIDSLPKNEKLFQSGKIEQELYKEWLQNEGSVERPIDKLNGLKKLDGMQDREHKISNQFVDVSGDREYQKTEDIDFEEIICRSWEWYPAFNITHNSVFMVPSIPEARLKHIEIKGGETVFGQQRYTRLFIETISNVEKKLTGWFNKGSGADYYRWVLPLYGLDGSKRGFYAELSEEGKKRKEDRKKIEAEYKGDYGFEKWKNEKVDDKPVRKDTDRFITELPTGLMITLSRSAIEKFIVGEKKCRLYNEEYHNHYEGYFIELSKIEDAVVREGWSADIPPAIPLVRYLTAASKWGGENNRDAHHYEGLELVSSRQYRYYVSREMLYSVYGFTETMPKGSIDFGDRIWIPWESEQYDRDAKKVFLIGNGKYKRDGSMRKISRIGLTAIEPWGELPAVLSGPVYQPIQPF